MAMFERDQIAYDRPSNGHSVRPPQIAIECEMLDRKVELLLKQLDELEERLKMVLRPVDLVPRGVDTNQVTQNDPLAPHADFLRGRNQQIERATEMVASILSRMEL